MKIVPCLAALVLLVGCSAPDAGTITATSPSVASGTPGPSVNGWATTQEFARAVLEDHDFDAAEKYVAPSSPAARFLEFRRTEFDAMVSAGRGRDYLGVSGVAYDETSGTVSFDLNRARVPVEWKDFEIDSAGRLITWSIDSSKTSLADRLATKRARGSTKDADVQLVGAYRDEDALSVILNVRAKDRSLSSGTVVLIDSKNRQREGAVVGPKQVLKGTWAYVVVRFANADLGGTVRYPIKGSRSSDLGSINLNIG